MQIKKQKQHQNIEETKEFIKHNKIFKPGIECLDEKNQECLLLYMQNKPAKKHKTTLQDLQATLENLMFVMNKRFDQVEERLDKVEQRLDKVEQRLDKVEQRLDKVEKDVLILKSYHQ